MNDASPPETERTNALETFTALVPENANDDTVVVPDVLLGTLSTELATSVLLMEEHVIINLHAEFNRNVKIDMAVVTCTVMVAAFLNPVQIWLSPSHVVSHRPCRPWPGYHVHVPKKKTVRHKRSCKSRDRPLEWSELGRPSSRARCTRNRRSVECPRCNRYTDNQRIID